MKEIVNFPLEEIEKLQGKEGKLQRRIWVMTEESALNVNENMHVTPLRPAFFFRCIL